MSATALEGVGDRSISAVLWGAAATFARISVQIVAQIVLARILGPEQYGLFAAALVAVLFSTLFSDVGLAYGLIRRQSIDERDVRFVFTWQTVLGLVVATALVAAAPLVARIFDDVRIEPMIRWLALACLFNAMGATAGALLKRDLDFKSVNLATLVGYLIGFLLVGIPLALVGWQAHALVAAFIAQSLASGAMLFRRRPHAVRPLWWHPAAADSLRFGATILATNLLNWLMTSADRVIIGRTFAMTAVGLYSTAFNLVNLPAMTAVSLVQSVLYAASSRVQDDRARLQAGFRTMFGAMTFAAGPFFAGIAAAAPTVVLALYGHRWIQAAEVLVPLSLAMPVYLAMAMAIPALWASGHEGLEFKLQVPIAVVMVLALLGAVRFGSLSLMAWMVAGLFLVRAIVIVAVTLRAIGLPASSLVRPVVNGLASSIGVAAAIVAVDRLARGWSTAPAAWLAADVLAGGLALAVMLRLQRRHLDPEVIGLCRMLADRLPEKIGGRVRSFVEPGR